MIWRPQPGQRVVLRYALRNRKFFTAYHDYLAVVICVGSGRGPINVLVRIGNARNVVVPRGNLFAVDDFGNMGRV